MYCRVVTTAPRYGGGRVLRMTTFAERLPAGAAVLSVHEQERPIADAPGLRFTPFDVAVHSAWRSCQRRSRSAMYSKKSGGPYSMPPCPHVSRTIHVSRSTVASACSARCSILGMYAW